MASAIHQIQGSYATFPSRPVSQNKRIEFKRSTTTLHRVVKAVPTLACKSCLSVRTPLVKGQNVKFLRIAAFKGSSKNDESAGRGNSSKSAKKSIKLSYVQQESENCFTESPETQNVQQERENRFTESLAIQNLFKNWLALLRTPPPPIKAADENLEGSDPEKEAELHDEIPKEKEGNFLNAIWGFFWGLDATVKVPILLFAPMYLAVTVAYGAQVSKELTPLWIFGPLIIAFYVKIIRWISALYVFTFKLTVKVVKNSPSYTVMVYSYIADGKLKEVIYGILWKPVVDLKNMNYKEFSGKKIKEFQAWAGDKYLDYVESIWPTYCKTIRFLKRANII